jgi:hypothetical protein
MADQEGGGVGQERVEAPVGCDHLRIRLAGAEGAQAQQATPELVREREALSAIRNGVPLLICAVKVNAYNNVVSVEMPKNWGSLLPLVQHRAVFPVVKSTARILPRTDHLSNEQKAWYGKLMRDVQDDIMAMALSPEYQAAAAGLSVPLPTTPAGLKALTLLAFPRQAAVKKLLLRHSVDGAQYWLSFYETLCEAKSLQVNMVVPPAAGAAAAGQPASVTIKYVQVAFTNSPDGTRLPDLLFLQPAPPAQPGPGNEQGDAVRAEDEDEDEDEEVDEEVDEVIGPLTTQVITLHITACVLNVKCDEMYGTVHAAQVAHLAFELNGNWSSMMAKRTSKKRKRVETLKPGPLYLATRKAVNALMLWRAEREACSDPPPLSVGDLAEWRRTYQALPDPTTKQKRFSAALKLLIDLHKTVGSSQLMGMFAGAIPGAYPPEVNGELALAAPPERGPRAAVTSPGKTSTNPAAQLQAQQGQLVQLMTLMLQQQQQQQQQQLLLQHVMQPAHQQPWPPPPQQQQQQQQHVFQQAQQQQQQQHVFQQEAPQQQQQQPPPRTPPSPPVGRRPLAPALPVAEGRVNAFLEWLGEDDEVPAEEMRLFATRLVGANVMSVAQLKNLSANDQDLEELMNILVEEGKFNGLVRKAYKKLLLKRSNRA